MRFYASGLAAALLLVSLAHGQSSTSYRLEERTFNAGGRPEDGIVATSASFAVTLDSIGDPFTPRLMSGATIRLVPGPVWVFPPPLEVSGLVWTAADRLIWEPAGSADSYNVYRDGLAAVASSGGACQQADVPSTSYDALADPARGAGFFYLVTANNRLHEEGGRGVRSDGTARPATPTCP